MLEIFIVNTIRFFIEYPQLDSFNTNFYESKGMAANNQVLKSVFDENTLIPTIELAILD